MADLNAVIQQLKDNKKSTQDVEAAVNRLSGQFALFLNRGQTAKMKGLEAAAEARSPISKSTSAKGGGFGAGLGAAGMGLGGLLKGGALAGLVGIAGAIAAGLLDGNIIKKNVEAILSIGERYGENTLKQLMSDGAVILALSGIGGALVPFAVGGALNAGVDYFATDWATNVKDNVETLLGIGDRYTEDGLARLGADGAVILAIGGLGAALVPFGVGGALNAGLSYFSDGTQWSTDVATNVGNLLGLADDYTLAGLGILFDGVGVSAALAGLGAGLTVFATGSGLAQFADKGTKWATDLKTNVQTLLSIADGPLENIGMLFEAASFPLAMTGLAAGLAIFSAGSLIATTTDAFAKWTGSTDWATNIKDNVVSLLSIKHYLGGNVEMLKDGGAFTLAMSGIGLGLAAFGTGAILSGGTDMLGDWFSKESNTEGGGNWAQHVVDNVTTLLGIVNTPGIGADTAGFIAVMGGISAGLLAFSTAGGATSIMDALSDWISPGEGRQNWTEEVKKNVNNLLSIVESPEKFENASKFSVAMGSISAGLLKFSGANFVTGLTNAAEAIISFFTGQDNAFDEVMKVADKADDLEKGSRAVDSLTVSIEKLGKLKFDGSTLNMKRFAEDLAASVPVIEKAIMGGKFDDSWLPFTEQTIKGLASPEIDYQTAIANISNLRAALAPPDMIPPAPTNNGGGGGNTVVSADDNSVTQTSVNPMSFPGNTDTVNSNDPNLKRTGPSGLGGR